MMNKKLIRIIDAMKEAAIPQIIVTDTYSIGYILGKYIHTGERMKALYINENGETMLFMNRLFPITEDLGTDIVWFDDIDDAASILASHIDHKKTLGVDKTFASGFLIRMMEKGAAASYVNGSPIVDGVRLVKDEDEREKMRAASKINDKVMKRMVSLVGCGDSEELLTAKCHELYKENGCAGASFPPIISFGKNAADPHHEGDGTLPKRGDCVVIDIGGLKDGYCSDMTRTVFLGEVSDRAREIYEVVLEANRRGIKAAKPGARMCDVDNAARGYITEKGFGKYFTHRTGHSIGTEVHEFGDVSSVNEAIIKPGQCFSVEPGIYIAEENIGVRIEDLVLITEDGCEVLNSYTKELTVVPFEG
ncbi:MAG: aminopeptidase P family protein [Clostridia bacterium]|nr:aminopeptidase P family protein [Clostridia bacterium]